MWGCSFTEQYWVSFLLFMLCLQLQAIISLWGWDQSPGPFAVSVSCANTVSVEHHGIYFLARLSQSAFPISTFHALIQGLLTAPTASKHLCSRSALSLHLHVDTIWAIVQMNIKNKVQAVDTVHTERREGKLSPSVSKGVLRMWHLC